MQAARLCSNFQWMKWYIKLLNVSHSNWASFAVWLSIQLHCNHSWTAEQKLNPFMGYVNSQNMPSLPNTLSLLIFTFGANHLVQTICDDTISHTWWRFEHHLAPTDDRTNCLADGILCSIDDIPYNHTKYYLNEISCEWIYRATANFCAILHDSLR